MRAAAFALPFCIMIPLAAAEPAKDGPVRVACVGDSITFGSGIDDRDENSYPAVLDRLLGDGYEVRNFGVGGATLQKTGDKPYWTLDAFKDVSAFNPQIVVVKLGTNDTKPQNWHGVDSYRIDLLALLNHFKSLPEEPQVFICTPVPVHKDAFGIREEVVRGEVVPTVKQTAEKTKTPLIDLYTALSDSGDDFPDGVHPNAAGARKIAETVAKSIRRHADSRKSNEASER
ncbi:MAG: GDSL-type esterase/lipase family protein [Planctomycetaceae bacterium]